MLRYERKYLVPNHLLGELRSRVLGFVREDLYATANGNGLPQYTVRSIYFDTPDLVNYHEKHAGLLHRRKLRVRGYTHSNDNEFVILEIKRKIGNRIKKHRAPVAYSNLETLLQTGYLEKYLEHEHAPNPDQLIDDAKRFFFHYKLKPYLSTTLVAYEREAYHGKINAGTRITFDKNIRSRNYPAINELFSEENLRYLFKSHFILEIKYFENRMPGWLKTIVNDFKLRHEALSKYTIGFDVNKTFAHY